MNLVYLILDCRTSTFYATVSYCNFTRSIYSQDCIYTCIIIVNQHILIDCNYIQISKVSSQIKYKFSMQINFHKVGLVATKSLILYIYSGREFLEIGGNFQNSIVFKMLYLCLDSALIALLWIFPCCVCSTYMCVNL